jgi:hypothetical protein
MKHLSTSRFLAPVALAITLGVSGAAVAQQSGAQGGAQGGMQQAPDIEVTDEQVEAFAEAQARVADIGEKWTPRMQEAESSEDVQKAREQAQQEMVIAVENAGLSVQEYNQIARAAQADEELRQKIQDAK